MYETQRCYLCPEVFLSSEDDAPNTVDTVAAPTIKSNVFITSEVRTMSNSLLKCSSSAEMFVVFVVARARTHSHSLSRATNFYFIARDKARKSVDRKKQPAAIMIFISMHSSMELCVCNVP